MNRKSPTKFRKESTDSSHGFLKAHAQYVSHGRSRCYTLDFGVSENGLTMGDNGRLNEDGGIPMDLIAVSGAGVPGAAKKFLKQRSDQFALSNVPVGKVTVVGGGGAAGELARSGGFYCKVCDCSLKDTITWINHINGRKHNEALGMKMQVEQATAAEVAARIEWHAKQRALRRHATEEDKRLLIAAQSEALTSQADAERKASAAARKKRRMRSED